MQLNKLSPASGSTKAKKRVGRGVASGWGKTCGTGHKGQKSRSLRKTAKATCVPLIVTSR